METLQGSKNSCSYPYCKSGRSARVPPSITCVNALPRRSKLLLKAASMGTMFQGSVPAICSNWVWLYATQWRHHRVEECIKTSVCQDASDSASFLMKQPWAMPIFDQLVYDAAKELAGCRWVFCCQCCPCASILIAYDLLNHTNMSLERDLIKHELELDWKAVVSTERKVSAHWKGLEEFYTSSW